MVLKKRGNLLDPLVIMVTVFALGILFIMGFKVFGAINEQIQGGSALDTDQKQMVQEHYDTYISVFDIGFLIVVVLLSVFIVVSAFLIDTHPIFLPIFVFIAIFVIIISAILGNVFYDVTTGEMPTERVQFPIITAVMDHFVGMIVGVILLAAAALYAKSRPG